MDPPRSRCEKCLHVLPVLFQCRFSGKLYAWLSVSEAYKSIESRSSCFHIYSYFSVVSHVAMSTVDLAKRGPVSLLLQHIPHILVITHVITNHEIVENRRFAVPKDP